MPQLMYGANKHKYQESILDAK